MRKPTSPQPTVPFAGRALTAREAAFGRPNVPTQPSTRAPAVRKSTLHTVRPMKVAATDNDSADPRRPSKAPVGAPTARSAPLAAASNTRNAFDTPVAVRRVAPTAVPRVVTDQRVVVGLVLGFLGCVIVLLSFNVSGNMRTEKSRTEMTETFRSVHTQQQMFRMLNSRFATWPELKATGASLPVTESVRASRADSSHWFLSLVDSRTNMICDRTGEMWDESPDDRTPVCRKQTQ
jgi:hypothetical protein